MVRLGVLVLLASGVAAAVSACTTNHDSLAKQPKAGNSAGGSAGGGNASGGSGNTGNVAQGGRTNPDVEPAGDDVLTIVNGVVDAPRVRLCFAHVGDDGLTAEFAGSPLPELPYAASSVHSELEGFSFERDVIEPWVLAGELSLIDGLDCQQAVELAQDEEAQVTPDAAGGSGPLELETPRLRARALATLPAGTVNTGRSILMVLSGCIGGAAYSDGLETAVCGDDYTPTTPTLQPLVVKLSRALAFDKVGLQAMQGSISTGTVDMRAAGDRDAVTLVFASSVAYGVLEPRPADTRYSALELGVRESNYGVQAVASGEVIHQASWPELMEGAGIDAILPGRTYTTVLLGPAPVLLKRGWWNEHAFALVDNDPTRAPAR